jgi:hypothetical protein
MDMFSNKVQAIIVLQDIRVELWAEEIAIKIQMQVAFFLKPKDLHNLCRQTQKSKQNVYSRCSKTFPATCAVKSMSCPECVF